MRVSVCVCVTRISLIALLSFPIMAFSPSLSRRTEINHVRNVLQMLVVAKDSD